MKKEHFTIRFYYESRPMRFDVMSNVHHFGSDIESAFINWSARITEAPSLIDFCNYVESKDPNFKCTPKYRKEVRIYES